METDWKITAVTSGAGLKTVAKVGPIKESASSQSKYEKWCGCLQRCAANSYQLKKGVVNNLMRIQGLKQYWKEGIVPYKVIRIFLAKQ